MFFEQSEGESDEVFFEGKIDRAYIKRAMISSFSGIFCCIVILFVGIIPFSLIGVEYFFGTTIFISTIVIGIIILMLVTIVIRYAFIAANVRNFSFQLTTTNIIIQQGVLSKRRDSIPFSRIQNISIKSGFFDRLFHLSTISIETAGSSFGVMRGLGRSKVGSSAEGVIPGQKDPTLIERKIRELIKKHSGSPSPV